jgi:hypothetical protein
MEEGLFGCGLISNENTSLLELEKELLELGAHPNVTQGVYYTLSIIGDELTQNLVRFLETGSFLGFFANKNTQHFQGKSLVYCFCPMCEPIP